MDTAPTFSATIDENARRRFEAAWRERRPEPIERFLPPADHIHFLPTLEELVSMEMELRWKAKRASGNGDASSVPVLTESYLQHFPQLDQPAIVLRLLRQEYRVRSLYGDAPTIAEYRDRFPKLVPTGKEVADTVPSDRTAGDDLPQIPGYEVLGPIGRGGMGIVYKARQLSLGRIVALKTISAGNQSDPQDRLRFKTEAQAIARFQDPNIVHVYEVGEHGGRLYFSMEFLEGGSLDKRLERKPQPPRAAAQLLEILARALARVHERGLIHRDLKPGNVLMTANGVPKISDFGLARRVEGQSGQTQSGAILGTPSYMAPEQAAGKTKEITPLTDVYALGAILYEMLTGRPPFLGEGPMDTVMQVLSSDPVPPRTLQPTVPRDLETICLKCLEKEPARRYASGADLADDLTHFLADEPIKARPVSRTERVWRWSRRHRLAASSLAALVVIIPLAIVGLTMLWLRAEDHRQQAETNLDTARRNSRKAHDAVDQLLTHLGYDKLLDVPFMEPVVRDVLDTALKFNKEFLKEEGDDPAVRFEVARAYRRAGAIERMLGRFSAADEHFQQGLEIVEALARDDHRRTEYRQEQSVIHLTLGGMYATIGRLPEAEKNYQQCLTLREQLAAELPTDPDTRHEFAEIHETIGHWLWSKAHRFEDAERTLRRALEVRRGIVADLPNAPNARWYLAEGLNSLSNFFEWIGRHKEALAARTEGIELSEALVKTYPGNQRYRQALSMLLFNNAAFHQGNPNEELQFYRAAIGHIDKLAEQFPSRPQYREQLAELHYALGVRLLDGGHTSDAEASLKLALGLQEKLVAAFPQVPAYRSELARTQAAVHRTRMRPGRGTEAEAVEAYRQAMEPARKLIKDFPEVPAYQYTLSRELLRLAEVLIRAGQVPAAQQALGEAIKVTEKLSAKLPTVPEYRWQLGILWGVQGRGYWFRWQLDDADDAYRKAMTIFEKLGQEFPTAPLYRAELTKTRHGVAIVYRNTKRVKEAEELHRRNIADGEQLIADFPQIQENRRFTCNVYMAFGLLLVSTGRHEEAEKGYRRALAINDTLLQENPDTAAHHNIRAGLLDNHAESVIDRKGDLKLARKLIDEAMVHEKLALKQHPNHPQFRLFMSSHWEVVAKIGVAEGDHAAAVKAAREIPSLHQQDFKKHRTAAEYVARCVPLAEKDAKLAPDQRAERAKAYADQAMALLRDAVQLGITDAANLRNSPELAPLRNRADFTSLINSIPRL